MPHCRRTTATLVVLSATALLHASGVAAVDTRLSLDGPLLSLVLVINDSDAGVTAGRTYLSDLRVKAPSGPTNNLLFSYNQPGHDSSWSPARLSSTALSWQPPPSPAFCGLVAGASPPTRSLALSCASPGAVMHITFAAYGTPEGGCDAPRQGACGVTDALATVAAVCEGQSSCTLYQGAPTFPGPDPCPNTPKALLVTANCSIGNGSADPALVSWAGATGGSVVASNSTHASIAGVAVGPHALEDWELNVASGLSWAVVRRYTTAVTLLCDRGPALVLNTQYDLTFPGGSQIPSVLDPTGRLNASDGAGFACPLGDGQDTAWVLAAALPDGEPRTVLLAPALVSFTSVTTCATSGNGGGDAVPCGLAFAWPRWPGVGGGETTLGLGLSVYSPDSGAPGPRTVAAGTTLALSWTWAPAASGAAAGHLPFNFSHDSAPIFASRAADVAARFNMWALATYGNSPASVVCLRTYGSRPRTRQAAHIPRMPCS